MKCAPLILLLCFSAIVWYSTINALECGIEEEQQQEEIQKVIKKCLGEKFTTNKNANSSSEESNSSNENNQDTYSARRGFRQRTKRENQGGTDKGAESENSHESSESESSEEFPIRSQRDLHLRNVREVESTNSTNTTTMTTYRGNNTENSTTDTVQVDNTTLSNNETSGTNQCVVQCFLQEMGMTDGNGYPEHIKVSQGLLKNIVGRELKDFVQDSSDECFQQVDQGEKLDSCDYSTRLVTCLADKGRSNCADWPVGNLPFQP